MKNQSHTFFPIYFIARDKLLASGWIENGSPLDTILWSKCSTTAELAGPGRSCLFPNINFLRHLCSAVLRRPVLKMQFGALILVYLPLFICIFLRNVLPLKVKRSTYYCETHCISFPICDSWWSTAPQCFFGFDNLRILISISLMNQPSNVEIQIQIGHRGLIHDPKLPMVI